PFCSFPASRDYLLALVALAAGRDLLERLALQLLAGDADHLDRRLRAQRRRASAIPELRALADNRTRAELSDHLAVDDHFEYSVEDEVHEVGAFARVALFDQDVARGKALRTPLAIATHDLEGKLTLQSRFDGGDDRGRVLIAPRRVLLVRLPIPLVEVDRPALLGERAILVVDPVTRESAGTGELVLGPSIGVDRERKRGPGDRGVDLEVRLAAHASRRRHAGPTARGLRETHPPVRHLGVLKRRHGNGRDGHLLRSELEPGQSDAPATRVPVVDDLAVLDLDPALQLVRLAEEIGPVHRVDVVDAVWRRSVVVGDADCERELRQSLDRLRRDPRDRGDG